MGMRQRCHPGHSAATHWPAAGSLGVGREGNVSSRALPQLQRIRGMGRAFATPPRPLEWGTWGAGDPPRMGK